MDKDFIKNNNLNEAVKRFQEIAGYKSPRQSLNEYTFIGNSSLDEEGEDDNNDLQQSQDVMQQPQNASPDVQNQSGDTNGQMNGQMQPQGNEMPQNGNMMPQTDVQQQQLDNSMEDMNQEPFDDIDDDNVETEEMEPEDEVIDVDDLTRSQEETEYKIDGVDDRLSKIFDVVQKFNDKLEQQQQSIINLKNEFEKRNPTQTEKFNIRSQAGGPFNQSVSDYWDKVETENPNYEIIRDNDVSPSDEQQKFEIKRGDISGLNMKNISDTLNINQSLNDYIGF